MKRSTRQVTARLVRRLGAPLGAAALMLALGMPTLAQGQAAPNLIAVTANNQLIRFSGTSPGTVSSAVAVTGLQSGESIQGVDVRPANGQLYAVGSSGRLYTVDPNSGAATQSGPWSLTLNGDAFGVDFNPVPDRLRVVSDGDQNLRINVDTAEATVDGTLKYAPADPNASANPMVVAAGYTNSMAGAQSTSLFVIDSGLDVLARQDPPNDGVLNTIGKLGVDVSSAAGFDIAPDGNRAFAALTTVGGSGSDLYSIDLTTGAATRVGPIGNGQAIRGLASILPTAAAPGAQPSPAAKPGAPGAMQMPAALPRAGEAEDRATALAGLASVGAGLLLTGGALVLRRRRA
jgi:LPXTG-motif cell wall-anchored protein